MQQDIVLITLYVIVWAYLVAQVVPWWLSGKESACSAGLRRSPGEGNGNPLQYSCLGNPMVRGTWQAAVHGLTKSQTLLSN